MKVKDKIDLGLSKFKDIVLIFIVKKNYFEKLNLK